MGFIHLLNWDEANFQDYSSGEAIRNVHIDKQVLWIYSISEFSMFFAKLNLIIIYKHHRFLSYRRKA